MKLVLGINYFNDIKALVKCMPSVVNLVDGVIAVDGSYKGYNTPYDYSVDGSTEYLKYIFKDKEYINISPNTRLTEIYKRNLYYEYMDNNYDWADTWLVVWDADWELIPKEGKTRKDITNEFNNLRNNKEDKLLYGNIKQGGYPESMVSTFCFGFHNIPGLRIKNSHFNFFDSDGRREVKGVLPKYMLKDCMLLNWFEEKSDERINQRSHYLSKVIQLYER